MVVCQTFYRLNMVKKSSTKVRNKRSTKRSGARGNKGNGFFGFLTSRFIGSSRRWAWWLGGLGVVCLYIWAFYYFFVGPTGFRWRALYGDANYPDGYAIHGIDISHYQGEINWDKLSDATIDGFPLKFVIVKSTEGSSAVDENFNDNFYQAREYGFIRGAYHFGAINHRQGHKPTFFLSKCT